MDAAVAMPNTKPMAAVFVHEENYWSIERWCVIRIAGADAFDFLMVPFI